MAASFTAHRRDRAPQAHGSFHAPLCRFRCLQRCAPTETQDLQSESTAR